MAAMMLILVTHFNELERGWSQAVDSAAHVCTFGANRSSLIEVMRYY